MSSAACEERADQTVFDFPDCRAINISCGCDEISGSAEEKKKNAWALSVTGARHTSY